MNYAKEERGYKTWPKIGVGDFILANLIKQHGREGEKKRCTRKVLRDTKEGRDLRIRKDKRDPGRSRGYLNYQAPLTVPDTPTFSLFFYFLSFQATLV